MTDRLLTLAARLASGVRQRFGSAGTSATDGSSLHPSVTTPSTDGGVPGPAGIFEQTADLESVRQLIGASRWVEAEKCCRSVLARSPDAAAYEILGYIAQQTGAYEKAVEACELAEAYGEMGWSNAWTHGLSLRALDRHKEAAEEFSIANTRAPQRLDVAEMLLEEWVAAFGIESAANRFTQLRASVSDPRFERQWLRLRFERGGALADLPDGVVIAPQVTARRWKEEMALPVIDLGQADDIPIEPPPVIGRHSKYADTTVSAIAPYLAELPGATLFSRSNIVLTGDGFAVNETGAHAAYGRFVSHASDAAVIGHNGNRLLLEPRAFSPRYIDAGMMLSGSATHAFGHWVPEYLPKLQFFEHHPLYAELPLIVDEAMPQSHFDYLACLTDNVLYRLPTGASLHCDTLVYAPTDTFFPVHLLPNDIPDYEIGPISPRTYRFLKARVEASLGSRPLSGGRYFLSRRNCSWRRLVNDAEISNLLAARGFETILIEDLSFSEQVRLFQGATHIVAPNGSAMQHIIFCDPSVRFLVLSQDYLANLGAFRAQTKAVGYNPQFLLGPSVSERFNKHSDYIIKPKDLLSALDYIDLST